MNLTSHRPQLIVILPAYNESAALPASFAEFANIDQWPAPWKLILVDDGSTDETAACGESWSRQLPISIVRHATNRGLGKALDTGLRAALEVASADAVLVTLDADNTHPPDQLIAMIQCVHQGFDLVIASRYVAGAVTTGIPLSRRGTSRVASQLLRWRYRIAGVTDYSSGLRAYRAATLRRIQSQSRSGTIVHRRGFECQVELLLAVAASGGVFHELPIVVHYERKPGISKMHFSNTLWGLGRLFLGNHLKARR